MPIDSRLRQPGGTKAEALENVKDAIKRCLEVRAERGMPLTIELFQAAGIWKDRDDLPTFEELRGVMNRTPEGRGE